MFDSQKTPWSCQNEVTQLCQNEVTQSCPTQSEVTTPWTIAYQAPSSVGFSRQEYWSGLPFPSPGDLPDPGIEPRSPALEADALTSEPPGKPNWSSQGDINFHPVIQDVHKGASMGGGGARSGLVGRNQHLSAVCIYSRWSKYVGQNMASLMGSAGKESSCNAGDPGLIPELGRFAGEGIGYPLQYSCLGFPRGSDGK